MLTTASILGCLHHSWQEEDGVWDKGYFYSEDWILMISISLGIAWDWPCRLCGLLIQDFEIHRLFSIKASLWVWGDVSERMRKAGRYSFEWLEVSDDIWSWREITVLRISSSFDLCMRCHIFIFCYVLFGVRLFLFRCQFQGILFFLLIVL